VPRIELPDYEAFEIDEADRRRDETPSNAITLDQAIARLISDNLDLRVKRLEISKSGADVVTAGLRANPLLYYDTQFIPIYGGFSPARPGGPTQYDLNVTLPLDLNHKRQTRVRYACQARRVVEAQYADAVRLAIAELYEVHVDLLLALDAVKFARATVSGLERSLESVREARQRGEATLADIEHERIRLDAARISLDEARASEIAARRSLTPLLNIPARTIDTIQFDGSLSVKPPELPPSDELVGLALSQRPDLAALRLAIAAADAGVDLASAERFQDIFLLVQPFTLQNATPLGVPDAYAAAVGVTIPMPLFDRNQGNVERARINAAQVRMELCHAEQVIETDVRQVVEQLEAATAALRSMESDLLPAARREVFDAIARSERGEVDDDEVMVARDQLNDLIRQHNDLLVRRRRAMLDLNTATGTRLMP
jgi:outer membrane protein, heavy metal efflux system